jgi:RNA polymerase sigma-70 factor (ECF subfamily)
MAGIEKGCDHLADAVVAAHIANGGYKQALEVLATAYQHRITRFCAVRLGGFRQESIDMAQEVFLNAYRSMPNFRRQSSVCTWLYGIAFNSCKRFLRDRSRRLRIENEGADDIRQEVHSPRGSNLASEEHLEQSPDWLEQKLKAALKRLKALDASVLLAHYADGHTVAAIASIHRTSVSTINRKLNAALNLLREDLSRGA